MQKSIRFIVVLFVLSFLIQSCQKEPQVKYCFLFIGDGMGVAQVNLTEAYLAAINGEIGFQKLSFTEFPHAGLVSTFSHDSFITCSSAAGTAFATGHKTRNGNLSTDTSGTVPYKSIATMCKEDGMKVGILSSVSIDHATPAVFYANEPSRNNYFNIGIDLINSDFDFFGGGGLKEPVGELNGQEINTFDLAVKNGFSYIDSPTGLMELKPGDEKIIAVYPDLLESGAMPYVIDKPAFPSLADFTSKAIELLENEKGFFMMVEGGKIDWACHSNDAATSIYEAIAFDDAVKVALEFYNSHPKETLIIVTADHETGGMALGNQKTEYTSHFEYLQHQKTSYDKFNSIIADFQLNLSGNFENDLNNLLDLVGENFGLGKEIPITEEEKSKLWFAFEKSISKKGQDTTLYGNYPPITETVIHLMSEKAGVGWTSLSHTGISIPIYAIGPGAELYSGVIDNTDIPKLMMKQLGIEK